ncbi:MAG: flavin reductase [Butyricicoccus pullicaecorum]|nr:flavin reductase [Butyricicoccus pullicaecorum]
MNKIELSTLSFNPFLKIRDQWALLAAGQEGDFNMMTVSWGGFGELWSKEVTTVYVRQSRYTMQFMDKNSYYALIFLKDGHKDALGVLGSKSGRDIDKMAGAGLTPVFTPEGVPTFEEAELTLVCRKLYKDDMPKENFLDPAVYDKCYADGNIHSMFVGEIVAAYAG